MRTEGPGLIALLASGCASTSIQSDLGRLEALTSHDLPESVLEEVDPATDEQVKALLEQPLDADAAVRIAIANNRELRASLRDLGVERGELLQASLLPNPTVEFDVRQPGDPTQPLQIDLYAEYEITHALLVPMRVEAAGHDLAANRGVSALGNPVAARHAIYVAGSNQQAAATGDDPQSRPRRDYDVGHQRIG